MDLKCQVYDDLLLNDFQVLTYIYLCMHILIKLYFWFYKYRVGHIGTALHKRCSRQANPLEFVKSMREHEQGLWGSQMILQHS